MVGVFLAIAFMLQEAVIAAGRAAGILAADGRPGGIDAAAARLGIEELANLAEMLIGLAPHGIGLLGIDLGIFFTGFLEGKTEMVGQPLNVLLGQGDQRVGTAITGAFGAIIAHDELPEGVKFNR